MGVKARRKLVLHINRMRDLNTYCGTLTNLPRQLLFSRNPHLHRPLGDPGLDSCLPEISRETTVEYQSNREMDDQDVLDIYLPNRLRANMMYFNIKVSPPQSIRTAASDNFPIGEML